MLEGIVSVIEAAEKAGPWILNFLVLGGMVYLLYLNSPLHKKPDTSNLTKLLDIESHVVKIMENHLHELPSVAENTRKAVDLLERIVDSSERANERMVALDSYLRARLNGGK